MAATGPDHLLGNLHFMKNGASLTISRPAGLSFGDSEAVLINP
jgi:hypothetical protein